MISTHWSTDLFQLFKCSPVQGKNEREHEGRAVSFVEKLGVLLILLDVFPVCYIINDLYFMKYVHPSVPFVLWNDSRQYIVLFCCFEHSYWTGHKADNTMSLPNIFWKWAGLGGKPLQVHRIHKSENCQVRWFWNWTALAFPVCGMGMGRGGFSFLSSCQVWVLINFIFGFVILPWAY